MLGEKLELLAPAGKWDVLESVSAAGADAVYLGGKKFNMRVLRPDFNFSEQELIQATEFLHQDHKKIYIALNNLYYEYELNELREYLLFLNSIKVDALIIQDLAIAELCRELDIHIPLHGSVQMGAGNLETVKFLEDKGFKRVILSKNLSLEEIAQIHHGSNLSIEFFAHGDLCVSHTGQCYMSQLIFGRSGNRGSCKKPCRWRYQLQSPEGMAANSSKYYLANNDLCVLPYLGELVQAGVTSFKIEGRMRNADFLFNLIGQYRQALDRLRQNPADYRPLPAELDQLEAMRVRDYTPGHLFGRPGLESIGVDGAREPLFNTAPIKISALKADDYTNYEEINLIDNSPELTVKVAHQNALQSVCELGVDNIILPLDANRQDGSKWLPRQMEQAISTARANKVKVYLETPRIVIGQEIELVQQYGRSSLDQLDGIIVNDYGSMRLLHNLLPEKALWAGPGLNITNTPAVRELQQSGIKRVVAPLELELSNLRPMVRDEMEMQVIVHGPLCGMVTDLCIPGLGENKDEVCAGYCTRGEFALLDEYGQKFRVRTDMRCRNYLFYPLELCLLTQIPVLTAMGIKAFTIEGQYYQNDLLEAVVSIYRDALSNLKEGIWEQEDNYRRLLQLFPSGLTCSPLIPCMPDHRY